MTQPSNTPREVEESTVSRPKEPEIGGSNGKVQPGIPFIFVMGVTGAGKSSFIKNLGGEDSKKGPPVTSAIESVTREVEAYKAILDGQEMVLVDTPGFEDNKSSNLETLRKICEYILQAANNPACIIHGAVYVHNIATSRWVAGDERTWSILQALCGDAAMGNVIVATTRWPADHKDEDFEGLEKRNLETHWKGILGTVRLAKNDVQNSRTVIQMLFGVRPKGFQVQQELSSGKAPSDTSAGRISITEGEEALSKAEKEKEDALAELARVSSQVEPVQPQTAPKLPQPPPPPPDTSAGRISTIEGEEVVSKVEKKEDALAGLARVSSQVKPVQPLNAPKLPQPPPPPPDTSAGRISTTEGEEVVSKVEKKKEDALVELARVSSQIKPVQPQNASKLPQPPPSPPGSARGISTTEGEVAVSKVEREKEDAQVEPVQPQNAPKLPQPPPPKTKGPSTANFEKEIDAFLRRLKSTIHAHKLQLKKIEGSENTLQEEIQQVQALLKEKEDLLEKYHQLRGKIESADRLEANLSALRTPVVPQEISPGTLMAMLLAEGAIVVEIGLKGFPFYGFAALGGVLLYQGVRQMMSGNANRTPTSSMEYQIPTMNIGEGVGLNDGSGGDG